MALLDSLARKVAIYNAATKIRFPQNQDLFLERANWKKVFLFLPRRCYQSDCWLWLNWHIRARVIWTGPGDPVIEDRYYAKDQGLWMLIKNAPKR